MSARTPRPAPNLAPKPAPKPARRSAPAPSSPPRTLTIILARAGSKGVPGKNRAPIAGKPCIQWTIDHARASKRAGLIVVSTDDPAITRLCRRAQVIVVSRPAPLATDTASVDAAARHALLEIESTYNLPPFTTVIILYANVPVRPTGLIDRAVDLLHTSRAHSVQSYAPAGKYHPWWTARVDPRTGNVKPWQGNVLNHGIYRRQNLPPAYIPDGGIIATTRPALMLEINAATPGPHAFFGTRRQGLINPEGSVIDIDSPTDLLVANATLRAKSLPRSNSRLRSPSRRDVSQ